MKREMSQPVFTISPIRGSGNPITDEELLDDLKQVARDENTETITQQLYGNRGKFDCTTVSRRFGSWKEALLRAGLSPGDNRRPQLRISKEELLCDLRRIAKLNNSNTVTQRTYNDNGRHAYNTLIRTFGSWNSALRNAGLDISNRVMVSDEELFENILLLWQKTGRQPRRRELSRPPSTISPGPYKRRFGTWTKALEAFVCYVNGSGAEPSSSDGTRPPLPPRRPGRNPNLRLRYQVLERDRFTCRSCGRSPALRPGLELQVDHIIPWSRGGGTVERNLQTLCSDCNLGKSNQHPG